MGTLVLSGDTSGSITLDAPAVAGSSVQTLVAATGTLAPLISGTAKSATGTSVDFTGIPSWVRRVTVMFSGVSTNGISLKQIQLGDSGGVETTGYLGSGIQLTDAASVNAGTSTTGIQIRSAIAADTLHGAIIISNISGNLWCANGSLTDSSRSAGYLVAGSKTLSDTLTQIRITTVNGTDTFDAGTINIMYE
jgi:hypothetical protein